MIRFSEYILANPYT